MGGAAGHMESLYEDLSLTFKEVKDIFSKISSGKMMVTEKLDGVCLHLSYSVMDGKARAARNYKNINEGGITLENINLLSERKEFIASITEAVKAFENVVKKIRIDEQVKIFGPNANYYYNCEIIDPKNPNILLYDRPRIIVHRSGHLKENKFNKTIVQETLKEEFLKLEKLLTENSQLNEDLGNNFIFETNPLRKIDELKDKSCYENAVKNLQNEINKYSVSEGSPLAEYVLSRLDEEVSKQIPELTRKCKIKLLERLMRAEGVTAKHVYETLIKENLIELTEKVRNLINSERKLLKEAVSPIEEIITEFGTGVLKEFKSKSIKDTIQESNRLKSKLQEIFDIVGSSQNPEAQNFLNNQFKKIKNIDNINLGCEGIVFKYNNNIYKITGLFSPINQILGMMNYQRGNVAPLKTLITMNENKTAVLSWGRFNPPTIGHEVVFKFGSDLAKQSKADFFIIPTKTTDKEKNPLTIQEKITYINKIFPEYTNNVINSSQINTIIEAAKYFSNKGYKNLKLVVGSDRKEQFEILNKYNNKDYSFNLIEIVSAGERLDEGEGAASMSASKMREAAIQGDIDAFMKGVAGRLELEEGIQLMNLIRSRIEVVDGDKKKFLEPVSPSLLAEVIQKSGNKWCVFSKKKTKEGKRKKLGCYNSRNGAKKRLRQVEYFKSLKEEQDLEEMSASGGGGLHGAPIGSGKKEEQLEQEFVNYSQRGPGGGGNTSRLGTSVQKRDDEPSRKEKIKILIMQEEQFMINRKEFVEEIKLRKIIREGLKRKMKEREEKILQEEQQLRGVIRKLLQEKDEEPPHPITGINVLRDLLKKIVPTIENSYKQLTTSKEQRSSFRAHLVKKTKDLLRTAETPEEKISVDVELKEQENEEELSQARQAAKADPRFIDPFAKKNKPKPEPELKPEPEVEDDGLDTTGRDMSEKTFNKIQKQIKDAYDVLSDPRDKDAFSEYLITNQLLHMDIFEDDMKTAVEEPTTASYEKEKQKLDSTPPEGDTTSQLPSSTPEQPPPASPNPVMERKRRK
jgi:nicotinic acid mononucleotide adenylyltransferase